MSAFGGKAEIIYGVAKSPLIAKSGHIDDGSSTSIVDQKVEGFDTYVG
jgi:hypothetical protein